MTPPSKIPGCKRLGAHPRGDGVDFALFSSSARAVDLCLFDQQGAETRIPLTRSNEGDVWHTFVAGAKPGQNYGYRVHGPYAPGDGLWFNHAKLLLDPYAKAMTGVVPPDDLLLGFQARHHNQRDGRDSAGVMPKGVVVEGDYDWNGDAYPRTPWAQTVLYECHVKGLTQRHPGVEPALRGTYLGLGSKPILDHLCRLGVTAVELLPIHSFVTEHRLAKMGLVNYWGYNSIGFFAPDVRYATSPLHAIVEFRAMVRALHQAGIEVILDVVYNHTAEGNELGPTLSFRGIDNAAYYHLDPAAPGRYLNFTACGNSLNTLHPRTQQLVLDSLRYWVTEMHVDGFRFDLAPALCREPDGVDARLRFFHAILQDPVLRESKLIVEPWDAGPDGQRVGGFPQRIREWNGRYRDCVRKFWRGDAGQLAEFASRIAGSSDVFVNRRNPLDGINYVTCHDGATLHDLVTYARKHNEANGEDNRDGPHDDFGQNFGVEGETTDPAITELRERTKRSLLATLAFSLGVPMLTAGDEMGRTQQGNTNAYCQDNELSWVDWNLDARRSALLEFTRAVFAIRQTHPAFRRDAFFKGKLPEGAQDVVWMNEEGRELSEAQWRDPQRHCLMMMVRDNGGTQTGPSAENGASGSLIGANGSEQRLLLLINAGSDQQWFRVPIAVDWRELARSEGGAFQGPIEGSVSVSGRGLLLLASR